ncbi:hypothetical protein EVAR_40707_1 [Eumeta japonica]|uniref:Uncharacterized protein n=1 Tax=Eumeta variegata TaxID=151549 RepID=A0A4C1X6B9_EUMVA|nr:hypothetical protein EVAR_40707_1 [Eumeta japonica]
MLSKFVIRDEVRSRRIKIGIETEPEWEPIVGSEAKQKTGSVSNIINSKVDQCKKLRNTFHVHAGGTTGGRLGYMRYIERFYFCKRVTKRTKAYYLRSTRGQEERRGGGGRGRGAPARPAPAPGYRRSPKRWFQWD